MLCFLLRVPFLFAKSASCLVFLSISCALFIRLLFLAAGKAPQPPPLNSKPSFPPSTSPKQPSPPIKSPTGTSPSSPPPERIRKPRTPEPRAPPPPKPQSTPVTVTPSPAPPTSSTKAPSNSCQFPRMSVDSTFTPYSSRFCLNMTLTVDGPLACKRYTVDLKLDPQYLNTSPATLTSNSNVTVADTETGTVQLGSPGWYTRQTVGQAKGEKHYTQLCGRYQSYSDTAKTRSETAVQSLSARCSLC